ncbi:hypothetical protein FHT70_005668 [Rhizobium sp. BK049]|nr:hypothetical protein [Rhizobium sp. BK049]
MLEDLVPKDAGREILRIAHSGDINQNPLLADLESSATDERKGFPWLYGAKPKIRRIDLRGQEMAFAGIVAGFEDKVAPAVANAGDIAGLWMGITPAYSCRQPVGNGSVPATYARGKPLCFLLDIKAGKFPDVPIIVGEDDGELDKHRDHGEEGDPSRQNGR